MSEVIVDGVRYIPVRHRIRKKRPLPDLLAEARQSRAESLDKAAQNIGTTKTHLWTMEGGGQCNPSLDLLQRLLDYYGIDFDEIAKVTP